MTRKQQRFIDLYTTAPINPPDSEKTYLNGAESARGAGYSFVNARHIATRLLANVYVKTEIEKILKKQKEDLNVTNERVIEGILKIAEKGEFESNRLGAWKLLAQTNAMLTDKTEVTHPDKEDNQFSLERLGRMRVN